MYIQLRYQDGTVETLLAWLEPDRLLKGNELRPGWRVDSQDHSSLKNEFFETALNGSGDRSGTVTGENGFEWELKGSEIDYVTTMMSSWVRKLSRFDPAQKPVGLADFDEGERKNFDRHQRLWLYYLPDPAATMDKIFARHEQVRMAQERMDALDDITKRYLYGWCAQFAAALHRETGWTMYGIHRPGEYGGVPSHVVCKMPNGLYADVRGVDLSETQICEGYVDTVDELTLRPVAMSEMLARFRREPGSLERAHEDLMAVLPSLYQTASVLSLDVRQDGYRYCIEDGDGGRLQLADLDLSEIVEILGDVPELVDLSFEGDKIEFCLEPGEEPIFGSPEVAIGWIESMLVAAAEGAPIPRKGVAYLTLPDVEIVAPGIR